MRERSQKRSISGLAALLSLGVFAAGILAVLLCGGQVYQRLTERDRMAYDSRTCVQFVATKIRQASDPDGVELSSFGDGDCLLITEEIQGEEYWTRVYCHDGWLMELFTVASEGFAPQDGEKILQVQNFELSRNGDLLQVEITDGNGTESRILLALRGGEGAEA